MLTRRGFLAATGLLAAPALLRFGASRSYAHDLPAPAEPRLGRTVAVTLDAAERPTALPVFGGKTLPLWTFSDETWLPVVRLALGDRLEATLVNRLPGIAEHTSIHWHGIRLPNDQDGVPYLVQAPVRPGEIFRYGFTPPDTGTFFFHTHCNTAEQLGRRLCGVLIVDGDAAAPYGADEVLLLRDWEADLDAATFRPFFTLRGAGRAGTYGPLRSANGLARGDMNLPASGDCRLRVINGDPTRIMEIAIEGADAAVIAIDGIAVAPFPLKTWNLGPAMRMDLAIRAPAAGASARLVDLSPKEPLELARFTGTGAPRRTAAFDPAPLRASRIPVPDLAAAERLSFSFSTTDAGAVLAVADASPGIPLGTLCLSDTTFWSINGQPWPDRDHAHLPPPLAMLERGRSYVFSLKNTTPFSHPIHFHGHTFTVLGSNKAPRPIHHADTVLISPDETVDVAFVADNPGDWMFHCHIMEHQETGMMAYLRVA